MSDKAVRICYSMAVLFVGAALYSLPRYVSDFTGWWIGPFMSGHFVCGVFFPCAYFLLWRKEVEWTPLKVLVTIGLTLIAFLNAFRLLPIWRAGAWGGIVLFGQWFFLLGIWCAGCFWVWWKDVLKQDQFTESQARIKRRSKMSPDAARLAMSGSLVFLLPGLFYLSYGLFGVNTTSPSNSDEIVWAAFFFCGVVSIVSWLALWKKHVTWTTPRKTKTAILAVMLLLVPLVVLVPKGAGNSGSIDFTSLIQYLHVGLPLLGAAAWFGGTARVWREKSILESITGPDGSISNSCVVHCPQCSYNLTGLREVRCPECGWASTVDDIVNRSLAEQISISGGSV